MMIVGPRGPTAETGERQACADWRRQRDASVPVFGRRRMSCCVAWTACFSKRSVWRICAASSKERPAMCSRFSSGRCAR